ncbi:A-kinase-interacting protein 1 isoform X1 [Channa argus]
MKKHRCNLSMASQTWLESSMQRSASLGMEVLERASRRRVNWPSIGSPQSSTATKRDTQIPVKTIQSELRDTFATLGDLMAQTTHQCKRFYESGCCTEPTDTERTHVARFHKRSDARKTTCIQPTGKQGSVSAAGEDFYIEVSPGTYAITACLTDSQEQTQLVSVQAGQSINLTFNL